jgi:hypothetical protein
VSPRKHRRRWNRAIVGWYFAGLVAVQFVVGAAVEWAGPKLRDPVYDRTAARLAARRAEYPDRPLLLAVGSSRTLMGLDAGRITRTDPRWLTYNLSDLGAGPMLEQVFLRRAIAAGFRPDCVLLELTPVMFVRNGMITWEEGGLDLSRLTGPELTAVSGYYHYPFVAGCRWAKARGLPCVSRQRELHDALGVDLECLGPPGDRVDPFGFAPAPRLAPAELQAALHAGAAKYRNRLRDGHVEDEPGRAFRDLVGFCRRERLPFAVMMMPECASFRASPGPQFRDELDRYLADLRRDGDFRLIDARAWVGDDGFWDAHHLNFDGAAGLSDRLCREWLAGVLPPAG